MSLDASSNALTGAPADTPEPLPIVRGADQARRSVLRRQRLDDALSEAELEVIQRCFGEALSANQAVQRIISEVREGGDAALRRISQAIDGSGDGLVDEFVVTDDEFAAARALVDDETQQALQIAADRVRHYHERQLQHSLRSFEEDGVGQVVRPLRRVGLYVPGTAAVYPSSVLHTAIPASVAGVEDICIASPISPAEGGTHSSGEVSPLKLVAAEIAGVKTVYKVGGAQAIAALAYGTESIPPVDKIFGPGGRFVTLAKRQVFGDVGIDAIYGPTETIIIADDSADAALVAADLLAQAEHDPLAAPILITSSSALADSVALEIPAQAISLERAAIALEAFANRGGIVLVDDVPTAIELANDYAPEHMALVLRDVDRYIETVRNAGGLFIGETSPEALADYIAGPSHVMPTGGSARYASPLHVGEFLKITSVVRASNELLQEIAPPAARIARAENLTAHARSLEIRREDR